MTLNKREVVYIGVDPGKVTGGFAYNSLTGVANKFEGDLVTVVTWIWDRLHEQWNRAAQQVGEEHHAKLGLTVIGMERYTLGTTTRSAQTDALEVIGAIKFLASLFPTQVILMVQGAADAQQAGNRENLIKVGWWTPGDKDQHHNRAAAQIALAMMVHDPRLWHNLLNRSQVIGSDHDGDDNAVRVR